MSRRWLLACVVLVLGAAALLFAGRIHNQKKSDRTLEQRANAIVFNKQLPDKPMAEENAEAAVGSGENRGPDTTPEVQSYLLRAYPETEVPGDATLAAQSGWASLNASPHSAGSWSLIGPSKATYPSVLTPFLFDGAQYVASGRVTAMAIAPNCNKSSCTLYLAAAGGGVWKTDKALNGSNWQFISGSFTSNAIGSLLIDPSDSSGNTVYAGTGEPNASGDSEAGVGVYKTTDGGQTWTLVPGSDMFFQRAIGQMALDNAGNLLVPVASGVRGVSSVTSGASSSGNALHPLVPRGLYRQNGATFTRIFTAPPPTRGSTAVKVDPTHPGIIYVNAFQQGVWRSVDNGVSFQQIFAPRDNTVGTFNSALERDEFDVNTLPNGATRMYVGAGEGSTAVNPPGLPATFWRSDNANAGATFVQFGGAQVSDYCTGQCWYDNVVYTPAGFPDVAYLGGSFSYGQVHGPSNGRAWLLSTDAGATWS
ncbi:MAG TPA: hypothetical protein VFP40_13080, partial [Terriglobales bacterium]|nr:hypothetical protein [Terriglobales bacterium]